MPLPEEFVKRNLWAAKGMVLFGVPVEDLTRDELIACVHDGYNSAKMEVKEAARQRSILLGLPPTKKPAG